MSHDIDESDLTDQFLRFGELESVAFQPGRSYAFVNFKSDEDAIASMKALQDFPLAGNPLRIEFAKAVSLNYLLLIFDFFCYLLKSIWVCVLFTELSSIRYNIMIINSKNFDNLLNLQSNNHSIASY